VIGLWVYDAGLFSERAEFSYDVVKRGDRAELFAPYRVPFVGLPLPQRKLDDDELERVRTLIERSYDQFVSEVATGRDTSEAYVREIGEGRVYTGLDAKERALVDEIGGLARAVVVAQQEAGLRGEEVRIREVNPSTGFLDLPDVLPFGLGTWGEEDEASDVTPGVEFVRTVLENQPAPLMILPPGYYE
jgi:protease-4